MVVWCKMKRKNRGVLFLYLVIKKHTSFYSFVCPFCVFGTIMQSLYKVLCLQTPITMIKRLYNSLSPVIMATITAEEALLLQGLGYRFVYSGGVTPMVSLLSRLILSLFCYRLPVLWLGQLADFVIILLQTACAVVRIAC